MKITNVRCEYLKNPLSIDIKNPRITWNFEGVGEQIKYRIIYKINDSIENTTPYFETKCMNYTFSYDFKSRDIITYKIEVINQDREVILSEENSFEIGLLNQNEFVANWITGNYKVNKKRRYPADYFRKIFETENVVKARLYITSCGTYQAYLNGKKIGDQVLTPGSTKFNKRIQYQTYDCLDLIKDGSNSFEIILGDGLFRGTSGAWGKRNVYGIETKVFAQLEIYKKDGTKQFILSDETFEWCNDGELMINDFKDGERINANLKPSYNNHAKLTSFSTCFRCSNNEAIKEKEFLKPIKEIITPKGFHILEFPKMIAGYISFKVYAKKGETIRLVLGEMIDKNKEFSLRNIQCRSKKNISPLQEINYICKEGLNEYKSKFFFGGFRYCLIETSISYKLEDFIAISIHNDFDDSSSFECSNNLINIFHRNTINSLKSNSIDIPSDCPTRERAGWTGDAQVFFNSASYLVDYASFARKYIEDMKDEQFKNGAYRQINPSVGEDWYMKTLNGSVGWSCAGVLIPYRFYKKYGDIRILQENYLSMEKYINFMIKRIGKWGGFIAKRVHISRKNRKFLVNKGQSYGEWLEPADVFNQKWTDIIFTHPEVSTAYTNYTISIFKEICDILGKKDESNKLIKYIDGTKQAYQELVSKKGYTLDTNRQACLVRPLYMKLLNAEQEEFAKKQLIKVLDEYRWRVGTGFLSTPFILDVLNDINQEYAYKLLENEEMPGWLYMAKNSTSSIWESWEGTNTLTNIDVASLNHYSKGAAVEFLYSKILGISISDENHFNITPTIGGKLTYCKGFYNSIYGKVCVSWKKENNSTIISFTIPANTKALFKYKDFRNTFTSGTYTLTFKE